MVQSPAPTEPAPLASLDRSIQRARLLQFLRYMLPVAIGLAGVYFAGGLLLRNLTLQLASADVFVYVAALVWARAAVRAGRLEAGAQAIAFSLLLITALAVPLLPFAFAAMVLIPMAAVTLVIPYLQGRALAGVLCAAFAVELFAIAYDEFGLGVPSALPLPVQRAVTTVAVLSASGLTLLLLFQDSRRLGHSLQVALRNEVDAHWLAERFRQLTLATTQIVWTAQADGSALDAPASWEAFTGQSPTSARNGGWLETIHPDDRGRVTAAWVQARTSRMGYQLEYRLRRGDGTWADVAVRAVPVQEPDGAVREWVGTITDITAQKQADRDKAALLASEQEARQRAEDASRIKDEFLATVSHELRTPLTAMLGWLQLLRGGHLAQEKWPRALETVERNARAQAQLVEDLLDVSAILSGRLRLARAPVELGALVEAAIESSRPAAGAKGVVLTARLSGPFTVSGDEARLQQVVSNLLSNAVKFTPSGGSIEVTLATQDGMAELVVADTGQGIALEFLPHVFEQFRQEDSASTRRHGGLGLGLSIVHNLVALHGGTVIAQSPGRDRGSRFTTRFPLISQAAVALSRASSGSTLARSAARSAHLDGTRILVVDDNADTREYLHALLRRWGAQVSLAANASDALEQLQTLRPDLLVSDIGMPGEDGYSLIRRVRALPDAAGGKTLALALTAYTRAEDRLRSLNEGFQLHLAKPVRAEELAALLDALQAQRST